MAIKWDIPYNQPPKVLGEFARISKLYLKFSKQVHSQMFGDCEYLQLGYDDVEKTIYMIPKSSQKEGRKVSVLPKSGNVMYVSWGPFLHRNDIFFGKPCDCKIQDAGVVDKKGKKIVISNCK